jgi:hypothetical protein
VAARLVHGRLVSGRPLAVMPLAKLARFLVRMPTPSRLTHARAATTSPSPMYPRVYVCACLPVPVCVHVCMQVGGCLTMAWGVGTPCRRPKGRMHHFCLCSSYHAKRPRTTC